MWRAAVGAIVLCAGSLAYAAGACPEDFDEFLRRFEASTEYQRANTRVPLPYTYIDTDAQPEPSRVKVLVGPGYSQKFKTISYPSPAEQAAIPLERSITSPSPRERVVRLDKPQSDVFSAEYFFARRSGCWQLREVRDHSL
jgi:hypothetical protein